LHRAAADARRLAELHELPTAEDVGLAVVTLKPAALLATRRRGITRFQITESIFTAKLPRGKLPAGLVWVPLSELDTITLSGPHRRWIGELLADHAS
jgi:A/G-specific adenine glycosylase